MQELKEQGAVHADLGCKVAGCGMQGLVQGPSGYFRLLSDTFLCISCLPCSLSGPRGAGGGMGLTTLGPRGAVLATECVCVGGGVVFAFSCRCLSESRVSMEYLHSAFSVAMPAHFVIEGLLGLCGFSLHGLFLQTGKGRSLASE